MGIPARIGCGLLLSAWLCVTAASAQTPRDVRIPAPDGFRLRGVYYPAATPGPGLLLLHQCNRRTMETGYEALAARLAAAGFHVLALDFRGFGGSTDATFRDWHTQMEELEPFVPGDVDSAYRYLVDQPGVDGARIGAVGASCGCAQAVLLARRHPEVRALAFLSGSFSERMLEAYEDVSGLPALIAFSDGDGYGTPASMREAFGRSTHAHSRLLVYKGTLHGTPLLDHDPGLPETLTAWFRARLAPGP